MDMNAMTDYLCEDNSFRLVGYRQTVEQINKRQREDTGIMIPKAAFREYPN